MSFVVISNVEAQKERVPLQIRVAWNEWFGFCLEGVI